MSGTVDASVAFVAVGEVSEGSGVDSGVLVGSEAGVLVGDLDVGLSVGGGAVDLTFR